MSENHSRKLTAVVFEGVEKSMSLREPSFGVQVRMRRYGRFVIMRSSGPEICGLEIGRKSRGGIGNVGFSIAVDELYTSVAQK